MRSQRSKSRELIPFDPEIERTFRRTRALLREPNTTSVPSQVTMAEPPQTSGIVRANKKMNSGGKILFTSKVRILDEVTREAGYGYPTYYLIPARVASNVKVVVPVPSGSSSNPVPTIETLVDAMGEIDVAKELAATKMLDLICEREGCKIGDYNLGKVIAPCGSCGVMKKRITNLCKQLETMVIEKKRTTARMEETFKQKSVVEMDLVVSNRENDALRARLAQVERQLDIRQHGESENETDPSEEEEEDGNSMVQG